MKRYLTLIVLIICTPYLTVQSVPYVKTTVLRNKAQAFSFSRLFPVLTNKKLDFYALRKCKCRVNGKRVV